MTTSAGSSRRCARPSGPVAGRSPTSAGSTSATSGRSSATPTGSTRRRSNGFAPSTRRLLERAAANDPAGWFGTAADVGNRWRVCGLAAAYTMLHAMGPARGRVLKYDQAVDVRPHLLRQLRQPGLRIRVRIDQATTVSPPPTRSAPVPESIAPSTPGPSDATARPPCPAPADFRAEVAAYDARAEVATWQGPRHRMTYRVLGARPAADPGPRHRVDLPRLCADPQPPRRAVPHGHLRLSRRPARRRRPARPDHPRAPGRRPLRPDRAPPDRPGLPPRPVVRLDRHPAGLAPRAEAVPQGRAPGGLRPPPVHPPGGPGAAPGAADAGHDLPATAPPRRS